MPEVWQFNGEHLRVWRLGVDGQYALMDEVSLVGLFRAWVRSQLAAKPKPQADAPPEAK